MSDLLQLLQTVSTHWVHAEQVRWTALYNFLVASTILILAWATISGSNLDPLLRSAVGGLLGFAGAATSVFWYYLGDRASGFVDMYAGTGREIEGKLQTTVPSRWPDVPTPFLRAEQYRDEFKGIRRCMTTGCLVRAVTCTFLLVYVFLVGFSVYLYATGSR